jgi:hypothetical protein
MSDQADPITHPWRKYLRFSARGLIVVVLVIGVWLGWIVRQAHIQRDAVAAIRKAGGNVTMSEGKPRAPEWLVGLIGIDFFGQVTWVHFVSPATATDTTLADIGHLTGLRFLMLPGSNVTDAGLVNLKGLGNLS